MKLYTERSVIQSLAKRWKQQYGSGRGYNSKIGKTCKAIKTLDLDTCSKEDVDTLIGNDSWTRIKCDECGKDVKAVVSVGEEPDYESATAQVCLFCLVDALNLVKEAPTR